MPFMLTSKNKMVNSAVDVYSVVDRERERERERHAQRK